MGIRVIVSLDIGTSKLCALALSCESLQPVAICSEINDTEIRNLPAGYHEQDPLRIRDLCLGLIQKLLNEKKVCDNEVVGIGITGQMHGVLLSNCDLEPQSNLITWRDQRTLFEMIKDPDTSGLISEKAGPNKREMRDKRRATSDENNHCSGYINEAVDALGTGIHQRTGCRLHAGYGGATLRWLAKNGKLSEGAVALTIADYVAGCLTGVIATEATHAASWGIFNLQEGVWDAEALNRLGITKDVLPPVFSTARPLGNIRPALAKQFGLGNKVQVCSPLGDNQASIIGAAGFADDAVVLNLGTGGQISIPQKEYKFVETLETRPMPFGVDPRPEADRGGLPDRLLSAWKLPFLKMTGGYASHIGLRQTSASPRDSLRRDADNLEEKGIWMRDNVIKPLFRLGIEPVESPYYVYFNVDSAGHLRQVLTPPKKYAPTGIYIMRIHGTFVNFLDLSPAIQEDIITRLEPKATA